MADQYLPLGPVDGPPYVDDFSYEDVKEGTCTAQPSKRIGQYLMDRAEQDTTNYLCVCVPCYNEDLDEMMKMVISLMENFDFMIKKVRLVIFVCLSAMIILISFYFVI
jgi:hypothetical protein